MIEAIEVKFRCTECGKVWIERPDDEVKEDGGHVCLQDSEKK